MRKLLPIAVLMVTAGSVYAQDKPPTELIAENGDKHRVETNRFWDNWFISAGGGAQMYFGDHNRQMSIGKQLSPALDVSVGKWFTPGIGVRLMYSGLSIKGATQNGAHSTGKVYDASKWLDYQKFDFGNAHADVMFNVTNMICGYKADRVYTLTPYAGLGWMFTWESPRQQEVSANAGILNTFRLSPALDLNLDVRGTLVNDRFDGETGGRKREGLLAVTVGLTYKFKQRDWNRSKTRTIVQYDETELNAMRDRLNEMQVELREGTDENNRLKAALAAGSGQHTETVLIPNQVVFFQIGSSVLSKAARVNLGFMAEVMKQSQETRYVISGYADEQTGNEHLNQSLSAARARAVYECLVNEFGVPAANLTMRGLGGVSKMFYNDDALSRAVITAVQERGE